MQIEIIELLRKVKKPLGRTEIAAKLKTTPIKISLAIKNLIKYNEIKCIEINRWQAKQEFGSKRRMRLYYYRD